MGDKKTQRKTEEEAPGVIRANVSLPRELKARMDKVTAPVNWSAVAARAFEEKLLELESKKETDMRVEEVVNRLRAAGEREGNVDYQAGFKAGQQWASNEATPKQLRRLDAYINASADWFDIDHPGWSAPLGATGVFALNVLGVKSVEADRHADGVFWAQAIGDDAERIHDQDFFHGFGEGALDVWEKVESQL